MKNIEELQNKIRYRFNNESLLIQALTHSSSSNEAGTGHLGCNERLEFLGDAVLELVVSRYLYDHFPEKAEGALTKIRSSAVREESLNAAAADISLSDYLYLGKGEEKTGGRTKPSVVSDACEALIGAVYLDGGYDRAEVLVMALLQNKIRAAAESGCEKDPKSELQELIQHKSHSDIVYQTVAERGPDHDKTFEVQVLADGQIIGRGTGKTKQSAEMEAAEAALNNLR